MKDIKIDLTFFDDFTSAPLAVLDGGTSGGGWSLLCRSHNRKKGSIFGERSGSFRDPAQSWERWQSLHTRFVYISLNKPCNKHLPRFSGGKMKNQLLRFFEVNRDRHSNFTDPRIHHQIGYQIVRKQPKTRRVRSLMKCKILLKATTFHPGFNMASSLDPYKIWAGRGLERMALRWDDLIFRRFREA